MNYKKWNRILIFSVSLLLSLTMVFNYIIDPYSVFNTMQIDGINKIKNNTMSSQITKFYTAKRSDAKVLLIGTSRTEHINPEFLQRYTNDKIYNLGLPGSGVDVQKKNIEYFIEKRNISMIIIGLDFFSFNPKNIDQEAESRSSRYQDDYLSDYLDSLLSIKTLKKSIKTLKDNIKNEHLGIDYTNGWRNYENDYNLIKKYGNSHIERKVVEQIKDYSSKIYNFNYPPFKEPSSISKPLNELKEIVQLCKENNVKLYMFISPLYSEITDLIYKRGYNETYTYWKKELSKYENIYDFSGYNSITTNLSNYVDGSHYQTKLAPLMFAKIFNDMSVDVPLDFGIVLNSKNIDAILKQQDLRGKQASE